MLNSLETYSDLGEKAGRAMRNHDAGMLRHMGDAFRRFLYAEKAEDRAAARAAYEAGYALYKPTVQRF